VRFPKTPKQDLYMCPFMVWVVEKGTKQQAIDRAAAKLNMLLPSDEGLSVVSMGAEKLETQEA